jgi:hypothetical protein
VGLWLHCLMMVKCTLCLGARLAIVVQHPRLPSVTLANTLQLLVVPVSTLVLWSLAVRLVAIRARLGGGAQPRVHALYMRYARIAALLVTFVPLLMLRL